MLRCYSVSYKIRLIANLIRKLHDYLIKHFQIVSFFIMLFICLFFAVLALLLLHWPFSSCHEQGIRPVVVGFSLQWLLESQSTGFRACRFLVAEACGLSSSGSRALEHRLSNSVHWLCSMARGIFLDQGWTCVPCIDR